MKYKVWFEIYGKRMQTTVEANNETDAKAMIKSKIIFYKVEKWEPLRSELKDLFNDKDLDDICNALGIK